MPISAESWGGPAIQWLSVSIGSVASSDGTLRTFRNDGPRRTAVVLRQGPKRDGLSLNAGQTGDLVASGTNLFERRTY